MGGHGGSAPGGGNGQRPQAGASLRGGGNRKRPKVRVADPGHPAPIGGCEPRAQARPAALIMLLVIGGRTKRRRGGSSGRGRLGGRGRQVAGRGQRVAGRGTSDIQSRAPLTVPEEGNAQTHGVPSPGLGLHGDSPAGLRRPPTTGPASLQPARPSQTNNNRKPSLGSGGAHGPGPAGKPEGAVARPPSPPGGAPLQRLLAGLCTVPRHAQPPAGQPDGTDTALSPQTR